MNFRRFHCACWFGMAVLLGPTGVTAFERDVAGVFGPLVADALRSVGCVGGYGPEPRVGNPFGGQGLSLGTTNRGYHNRHREYVASLARFQQVDPLEYDSGANSFEYVKSAPNARTDPTGMGLITAANDQSCRAMWRFRFIGLGWVGHVGIEWQLVTPTIYGPNIKHSLEYGDGSSRSIYVWCGHSNCKGADFQFPIPHYKDEQTVDSCWCNCFTNSFRRDDQQRSRYGNKCHYCAPAFGQFCIDDLEPCHNSASGIHAAWALCKRVCANKAEFRQPWFSAEPMSPGWWNYRLSFHNDSSCLSEYRTWWGQCVDR